MCLTGLEPGTVQSEGHDLTTKPPTRPAWTLRRIETFNSRFSFYQFCLATMDGPSLVQASRRWPGKGKSGLHTSGHRLWVLRIVCQSTPAPDAGPSRRPSPPKQVRSRLPVRKGMFRAVIVLHRWHVASGLDSTVGAWCTICASFSPNLTAKSRLSRPHWLWPPARQRPQAGTHSARSLV
jgi:hypothetical protein